MNDSIMLSINATVAMKMVPQNKNVKHLELSIICLVFNLCMFKSLIIYSGCPLIITNTNSPRIGTSSLH